MGQITISDSGETDRAGAHVFALIQDRSQAGSLALLRHFFEIALWSRSRSNQDETRLKKGPK